MKSCKYRAEKRNPNKNSARAIGNEQNVASIQGREKEMSPCLNVPASVRPDNLDSQFTANRPVSESLSTILYT